jgi:hypothetical protein
MMPAACSGCGDEIDQPDETRRADKGDVEQQHQDRHATDHLDIEPCHLAQDERVRQTHHRDRQPEHRSKREAD